MPEVSPETDPSPDPPPSSWAEVIDRAKARHHVQATGRLVRIAEDGGHKIGRSSLSKFENNKYLSKPSQSILEALAYLSGVPLSRLIELAGTGDPTQPPFSEQVAAIEGVNFLAPGDRRVLEELIRQLVDLRMEIISLRQEPTGEAVAAGEAGEVGEAYLTRQDVAEGYTIEDEIDDEGTQNPNDRSG